MVYKQIFRHFKMFKNFTSSHRTFKNFGHKREPIPFVTTLWHGALTFTFIGLGIEWKRIKGFFFGNENEEDIWAKIQDEKQESNMES